MKRARICYAFNLFFFCLIPFTTYSQIPDSLWIRTYENPGNDVPKTFEATSDGGFILLQSTNDTTNFYHFGLIKTDSDGFIEWTKSYELPFSCIGQDAKQTTDGGYIITGYTLPEVHSSRPSFLLKADALGEMLWFRTYCGGNLERTTSLQQCEDNGFILSGTIFNGYSYSCTLLKTDSNGDSLWYTTYGDDRSLFGKNVIQTSDGGFIQLSDGSTRNPVEYNMWDIHLIKTSPEGVFQWERSFHHSDYDEAEDLKQDVDGGFIICGGSYDYNFNNYRALVIKTDENGETIWLRSYDPFRGGSIAYSIDTVQDDGYVMTSDYFGFVRITESGDINWVSNYCNSDYSGILIKSFENGEYFLAGCRRDVPLGNRDIFLLKVGTINNDLKENNFPPSSYEILSIYPNPFNPSTTISISLCEYSHLTVNIFDIQGREVALLAEGQYQQGNHNFTFDGSGLASGIYFVQAIVPDKINEIRKIVLVK